MRREGRAYGYGRTECQTCGQTGKLYRCRECSGGGMFCSECIVARHVSLPLHMVEVRVSCPRPFVSFVNEQVSQEWTGQFFQRIRLSTLGLRIQLGHDFTSPCPHPTRATKEFLVIHHNGIHQVSVDFCSCSGEVERWRQLLRFGWYPATPINPQTCATFDVLRLFQILNLQGKISAHDFYHALVRMTDGYGIEPLPVSLFVYLPFEDPH